MEIEKWASIGKGIYPWGERRGEGKGVAFL
jgi:hypothetical protein